MDFKEANINTELQKNPISRTRKRKDLNFFVGVDWYGFYIYFINGKKSLVDLT